ncbi:hypothetical protein IVIADoCa4_12 [Xanthomonas phage vB_Xar_IVIA-DoCa4]|uniref:Uncharacterized protein n=1 Tax=Xanthomonas phage vB_Xar_IVIA-DoCa4 TaxID=2975531 RepID=A0A9X9NYP9_9CAUD|nr:hypothetical protein IVIADoCa4_12 [Xanthomonas phage vB_Xar_IVIA-DoCa4]
MSKTYFGITRAKGTNTIVGVVANPDLTGSRAATPEEVQEILSTIKPGATESLSDALRDGTYPNTVVVWDKRAAARAAIGELESFESPHFDYGVGEFGDKVRSVQPVLGWRIKYDGDFTSCYNSIEDGATVRIDGDEENNDESNLLFPTRAAAREVLDTIGDKRSKGNPSGYFIEAVYADA